MPKNRTSMTVELNVLRVDDERYSSMTLEFPEGEVQMIKGFDPERVYLEDQPGNRFSLVDPEGHRYCGVEKSVKWTEAAESRGLFFLVMQAPAPRGEVVGRILVVKYPFGQILRDTEVFRTGSRNFTMAILDGTLIRKALKGLGNTDLLASGAN